MRFFTFRFEDLRRFRELDSIACEAMRILSGRDGDEKRDALISRSIDLFVVRQSREWGCCFQVSSTEASGKTKDLVQSNALQGSHVTMPNERINSTVIARASSWKFKPSSSAETLQGVGKGVSHVSQKTLGSFVTCLLRPI